MIGTTIIHYNWFDDISILMLLLLLLLLFVTVRNIARSQAGDLSLLFEEIPLFMALSSYIFGLKA